MDYDAGKECSACFSGSAERMRGLLNSLQRQMEHLQGGAWRGRGADAFYAEMKDWVLPAVDRLVKALEEACRCTGTLAERFQAAEREAGALFVGGAGDFVMAAKPTGFAKMVNFQGEGGDGEPDPGNPGGRSEVYSRWAALLRALGGERGDIRFYNAAAKVTTILGMSEQFGSLLNFLGMNLSPNAAALLETIGADLFSLNQGIYQGLTDGTLIAPDGRLISPLTGQPVNSALEWDLDMVRREQQEVERIIQNALANGQITESDIRTINGLLNINRVPVLAMGAPFFADLSDIERAQRAVNGFMGGNLDFGQLNHRIAIGWAMVFAMHGRAGEYGDYAIEKGIVPPHPQPSRPPTPPPLPPVTITPEPPLTITPEPSR
jgi:WXG100 family type VII secretion target